MADLLIMLSQHENLACSFKPEVVSRTMCSGPDCLRCPIMLSSHLADVQEGRPQAGRW